MPLKKDFFSNREIPTLLARKISFYKSAVCAAKVVDAVGEIFANVDFPVRVSDFVDHLH